MHRQSVVEAEAGRAPGSRTPPPERWPSEAPAAPLRVDLRSRSELAKRGLVKREEDVRAEPAVAGEPRQRGSAARTVAVPEAAEAASSSGGRRVRRRVKREEEAAEPAPPAPAEATAAAEPAVAAPKRVKKDSWTFTDPWKTKKERK